MLAWYSSFASAVACSDCYSPTSSPHPLHIQPRTHLSTQHPHLIISIPTPYGDTTIAMFRFYDYKLDSIWLKAK